MIIDRYVPCADLQRSPEQYTVYKDGEHVAYIRLRHGFCIIDAPLRS